MLDLTQSVVNATRYTALCELERPALFAFKQLAIHGRQRPPNKSIQCVSAKRVHLFLLAQVGGALPLNLLFYAGVPQLYGLGLGKYL